MKGQYRFFPAGGDLDRHLIVRFTRRRANLVASSSASEDLAQDLCRALNGDTVAEIKGWEFWATKKAVVASDGDVPCCVLTAYSRRWARKIARILAGAAAVSRRAS